MFNSLGSCILFAIVIGKNPIVDTNPYFADIIAAWSPWPAWKPRNSSDSPVSWINSFFEI